MVCHEPVACLSVLLVWMLLAPAHCIHKAPKSAAPPPGYKHTAFRLVVPEEALVALHWHDALRHAAFLSLRRRFSSFDGQGAQQRAEVALWNRLSTASIFPHQLATPVNEDADITNMASGVLVRDEQGLAFKPEATLLDEGQRKIIALWSILRVRHSGPGLLEPRVELYFTVQPASHLTILDYIEKYRNKILKTQHFYRQNTQIKPQNIHLQPSDVPYPNVLVQHHKVVPVVPLYRDPSMPRPPLPVAVTPLPNLSNSVFGSSQGQYYDPRFVQQYRDVIEKYVAKPQNDQTLLTIPSIHKLRDPSEPIYIIPSPRLVNPPDFPRLSGLLHESNGPKLVKILIPGRKSSNTDYGEHESQESSQKMIVLKITNNNFTDVSNKTLSPIKNTANHKKHSNTPSGGFHLVISSTVRPATAAHKIKTMASMSEETKTSEKREENVTSTAESTIFTELSTTTEQSAATDNSKINQKIGKMSR